MAWQPIETAPTNKSILLWGKLDGEVSGLMGVEIVVGSSQNGFYWTVDGTDYYSVTVDATHWMPLPPPPKVEA